MFFFPPKKPKMFAGRWCTIVVHCRHLPPLQLSSPLRVSAISHRPLLSFPFVVCRPISHAVVIHRCCCPPLPSLSATVVFRCRGHHHHLAVSTVFYHPLLSFPIAFHCPIMCVIVVHHRCHPPPLLSTIAIPPLVLPPTRC